jgi:uncharacterized protein DUF4058
MPSPFPGMDPFVESQEWDDFHPTLITILREELAPLVRPRYVIRVERRVYLEHVPDELSHAARPDVLVLERARGRDLRAGSGSAAGAVAAPFVELMLPVPEEQREAFLTIRERGTLEVVTVIELLSPSNKRPGADGHREYLAKRTAVLRSAAHLVELDLLRGGQRLPTIEPLPVADYYAVVSREQRRPWARIYPWTVRDRLPEIPIPLAGDDADVPLDLQAAFDTAYDRAGYDLSLDYRRPVEPALSEADAAWVQEVLAAAKIV